MNQILYTDKSKKNKSSQTLEVNTVMRIFGVAIIIFAIVIIGIGVFSAINGNNIQVGDKPQVTIAQQNNILKLNISHKKTIDKIIYSLNEGQEYLLQGRGRNKIEEQIELPIGATTLNLKITDIEGKTTKYTNKYDVTNSDITKPEIELLLEGSKVKIVAKDETELDYIIYYWNDEEETRVDAREDSLKQIEEKTSILKGENTLTIVAMDKSGNETIKEQTYIGAKKPTVEMARDNDELVIKAKDDEGIQKIEYVLNGLYYSTDPNKTGEPLNMKEVEFRQKLATGTNSIVIQVYNISGLVEEISGETTVE